MSAKPGQERESADVEQLVVNFALLVAASERGPFKWVDAALADLEDALGRMPDHLYEALTLRGLRQLTNFEAARRARVHENTMSRHYLAALRWLRTFMDDPQGVLQRRSVEWREWAQANDDVLDAAERATNGSSVGRPPQIPLAVDERVLTLHCAGSTEREIASALNDEFPRLDGGPWTRSSVRSVLRRYGAPKRPRGRSPQASRLERSNYREIAFGEPLCDPTALLRAVSPRPRRER